MGRREGDPGESDCERAHQADEDAGGGEVLLGLAAVARPPVQLPEAEAGPWRRRSALRPSPRRSGSDTRTPREHETDDVARSRAVPRTGKRQQAQEDLTTATTMYREMDMRFWLEQAEGEMRELEWEALHLPPSLDRPGRRRASPSILRGPRQ